MGKPFEQEIKQLPHTIQWAMDQPTNDLRETVLSNRDRPLFVVGSGGSLSAAHYTANLYQRNGTIAKAITPLDTFYSGSALRGSNVIFLSASGKNTDILFGFQNAVAQEPNVIVNVIMRRDSALKKLSDKYPISKTFEFDIPTKKDGFLATNSLLAFFTIIYKTFHNSLEVPLHLYGDNSFLSRLDKFVHLISSNTTFTILFGGWGQPVAVDLESKLTEAALAPTLLADYRNFAHGRHHWFAKKAKQSAVIALVTPTERKLAHKTLSNLPGNIPRLIIDSKDNSPSSSIDLLLKSLSFVGRIGQTQGIDPGRPGVPEFGSKLYNMRYRSTLSTERTRTPLSSNATAAILRKTIFTGGFTLTDHRILFWKRKYENFRHKLESTKYGSLVFDYDGTLCYKQNRFTGISPTLANELIKVATAGFIIGIATGRGQSVRRDLRALIPSKLWNNFIIGYYNGSELGLLSDTSMPQKTTEIDEDLSAMEDLIRSTIIHVISLRFEKRSSQITIDVTDSKDRSQLKSLLLNTVMQPRWSRIQLLESGHSIDLAVKATASKLNLASRCIESAIAAGLPGSCLCIGDKGQWPGNDFELLATPYSLSVDEVSPDPDSCWNLAEIGIRGPDACLSYMRHLRIFKRHMMLRLQ